MSARSLSRWLLTETYSPSAIEIAPPTRPAIPATSRAGGVGRRARDADDERSHRDDAVVRTEHAGAQPVQSLADTAGVRFAGVGGVWCAHLDSQLLSQPSQAAARRERRRVDS